MKFQLKTLFAFSVLAALVVLLVNQQMTFEYLVEEKARLAEESNEYDQELVARYELMKIAEVRDPELEQLYLDTEKSFYKTMSSRELAHVEPSVVSVARFRDQQKGWPSFFIFVPEGESVTLKTSFSAIPPDDPELSKLDGARSLKLPSGLSRLSVRSRRFPISSSHVDIFLDEKSLASFDAEGFRRVFSIGWVNGDTDRTLSKIGTREYSRRRMPEQPEWEFVELSMRFKAPNSDRNAEKLKLVFSLTTQR